MMCWRRVFITLCLLCCTISAGAISELEKPSFDLDSANKQFDEISLRLSTQNLNINELNSSVRRLDSLQEQAKTCVTEYTAKLKEVEQLVLPKENTEQASVKTDAKFLADRREQYANQLAGCRLFVYRSEQAISAYRGVIQRMSAREILQRDIPIWSIGRLEIFANFSSFNTEKFYSYSGLQLVTLEALGIYSVLLSLLLLGIQQLRKRSKRWLGDAVHQQYASYNLIHALHKRAYLLCGLFATSILSFFYFPINGSQPFIVILLYYGTLIYMLHTISAYLLAPKVVSTSVLGLEANEGKRLYRYFAFVLFWMYVGVLLSLIFSGQAFTEDLVDFTRAIYMSILIVAFGRFIFLLATIYESRIRFPVIINALKLFVVTIMPVAMVAELSGYHQLSLYLIRSTFFMFLTVVSVRFAISAISNLFVYIEDDSHYIARKIQQILRLKSGRMPSEIYLLKFIGFLLIFFFATLALLFSWDTSVAFINQYIEGVFEGVKVSGITIIPIRIFTALILFMVILFIGRLLASYIVSGEKFVDGEESQNAIATIVVYIFFSIAVITALMSTGIDFTDLAIIAGALSVGIGLGLQNIVNNFVSGLILLIEKPVKPGDRVIIGDTEGFIKKIRIRSTQISTLAREDIIVPNADLVTQKITNFMYLNRFWRVVCQVGVAYGSDTDLVRKVLLQVAEENDDVVKSNAAKPAVLFRQFGDSTLNFELWCIIHDVNKKYHVQSDLNFAIDKAFRENNITIAFPQCDVHIKEISHDAPPSKGLDQE